MAAQGARRTKIDEQLDKLRSAKQRRKVLLFDKKLQWYCDSLEGVPNERNLETCSSTYVPTYVPTS